MDDSTIISDITMDTGYIYECKNINKKISKLKELLN